MPLQAFGECPGRFTVPPTAPLNITDRRLLLFTTVLALTCVSFGELLRVSIPDGVDVIEGAILALFLPLFAWIAFSFGSALAGFRSEETTSELQSLMRISYAVFCLQKNTNLKQHNISTHKLIRHRTTVRRPCY